MDASKTQKISSIDWIPDPALMRVIACIAIIVLHTVFAANEYFIDGLTVEQNIISRIIENNMMWAVPVFLMVTGALQLDPARPLTLRKLYGKYILRVAGALAVFSVLFRLFDIIMDGEPLTLYGVLKAFGELLNSSGWGHLWYLYLLIGLYILMPFYKKIAEVCSDQELFYLITVYCVFLSLIPMIEAFGIKIGFYISESLVYPLYLFLGHMIHERRLRITKAMGAACLLVSLVLISVLTVLRYRSAAPLPSELFGYQSPLVIIQSAGVFSLLDGCNCGTLTDRKKRLLKLTDKATFGIYLVHMVFVRLLFRYLQFNPYDYFAPFMLTICIVCIFVLSYLVVILLKRIPLMGRLL